MIKLWTRDAQGGLHMDKLILSLIGALAICGALVALDYLLMYLHHIIFLEGEEHHGTHFHYLLGCGVVSTGWK